MMGLQRDNQVFYMEKREKNPVMSCNVEYGTFNQKKPWEENLESYDKLDNDLQSLPRCNSTNSLKRNMHFYILRLTFTYKLTKISNIIPPIW